MQAQQAARPAPQPRFVLPRARDAQGRPLPARYRCLQTCFIDDVVVSPEAGKGIYEEILFCGIPNEQMEPLDDLAKERVTAYLHWLDECAWLAGKHSYRVDLGDEAYDSVANRAREGALVLPQRPEQVPLMPNLPGAKPRERSMEVVAQTPEQKAAAKPRKVLGTVVAEASGAIETGGAL